MNLEKEKFIIDMIKTGQMENIVMLSDSYKYSHFAAYEDEVVSMFDYAEARSNKYFDATQFFGLQYYLKKYLSRPVIQYEVDEAYKYSKAHGIPFDKKGWDYIVQELGGKIPVEIRAVKEGTIVPIKNVLFTIESTDKKVFWIASWMETMLMKVWYPCNIATRTLGIRKMLLSYAEKSSDNPFIDYSLHNFGDRGSSSVESAAIGGMAELISFRGTDNFNSIRYVDIFYKTTMENIGHSIPALEHSTVTSWGKNREFEMFLNFMEKNKKTPIVAFVMDSYDYFKAVEKVTSEDRFVKKINSDEYPIFVIRPDSGDPKDIIPKTLDIMEKNKVSYIVNKKGFKVWNKMRLIWGDGITEDAMEYMCEIMISRGYSTENIAFGMGGALMQGNENVSNNRDTQGFAIKNSSITYENGDKRDVYKDPITAPEKKSKKGELTLWFNKETQKYITAPKNFDSAKEYGFSDALHTVFRNGEVIKEWTFDEVRNF